MLVTFAALWSPPHSACLLAVGIASSRLLAAAIQPWAVVLQVTPIVAIAPLIIVWVGNPFASLVVCATIVAFFPVFANTAAGLASAPAELADLFRLYGAGRSRHCGCCACRQHFRTSSPACAFRAAWRWSARWWRSSSQGQAGSRRVAHTASWRLAIGCNSAHVRGTGTAVGCRHCDQLRAPRIRRSGDAPTRRRLVRDPRVTPHWTLLHLWLQRSARQQCQAIAWRRDRDSRCGDERR